MSTHPFLQQTPLYDIHQALGARMSAYAGFNMPISYTSLREEHQAVRERAGLFDVSHMGEFIVRGKEALDLIQYVTSNDASKLEIGQAQYSCFPTERPGIVDDLIVYRLSEDHCSEGERAYMLVVNASNIDKDWDWIQQHNSFDTEVINISYQSALLALQGPRAAAILQQLTKVSLDQIKFYHHIKGQVAGIDRVLISATGYTGSGGFELYVDNEQAPQLWEALMQAGASHGMQAVGLGARDTLRLEMGYCLYGNDIDETTSPLEAGLGWITKLKKGDFVGRQALLDQKAAGLSRKLVGLVLEGERRAPRQGYPILSVDGKPVGEVTSGTVSPSLGYPVGLGYVPTELSKRGTEVLVDAGRKQLHAVVQRPPFVQV